MLTTCMHRKKQLERGSDLWNGWNEILCPCAARNVDGAVNCVLMSRNLINDFFERRTPCKEAVFELDVQCHSIRDIHVDFPGHHATNLIISHLNSYDESQCVHLIEFKTAAVPWHDLRLASMMTTSSSVPIGLDFHCKPTEPMLAMTVSLRIAGTLLADG